MRKVAIIIAGLHSTRNFLLFPYPTNCVRLCGSKYSMIQSSKLHLPLLSGGFDGGQRHQWYRILFVGTAPCTTHPFSCCRGAHWVPALYRNLCAWNRVIFLFVERKCGRNPKAWHHADLKGKVPNTYMDPIHIAGHTNNCAIANGLVPWRMLSHVGLLLREMERLVPREELSQVTCCSRWRCWWMTRWVGPHDVCAGHPLQYSYMSEYVGCAQE
jgi:hypothetical protein